MHNHIPKLAIGFIVFKSECNLHQRLLMLNALKIPFYIYDNSPECTEIYALVADLPFCKYITDGKNLGLGLGLKTLAIQAYEDGFEALLFFDQDTSFTEETIHFSQSFFSKNFSKLEAHYSAVSLSSKKLGSSPLSSSHSVQEVDLIINSGSVFFLKNLSKMAWHNASYFVDGVDYEFCLRSHIYGMKVGICQNVPGFDHVSEQPDEIFNLFGKRLLIRRYSAFRIRDALHSYGRLIYTSLISGQFTYAVKFMRSSLIYLLGLTLSRVLLK